MTTPTASTNDGAPTTPTERIVAAVGHGLTSISLYALFATTVLVGTTGLLVALPFSAFTQRRA